jgi:MerR family transcriptional regulator, light-induced transcriptional regulator
MLESPQSGSHDQAVPPDDSVIELASRALSILSSRNSRDDVTLQPSLVLALHDAAVNLDTDSFQPALAALRDAQITNQQIADHYLPAVARKLGEEWCDDEKSFAEVTIGVARLQRLLLDLGPEWRADIVANLDAPTVLVLTGPSADHTFGARILVGQLRRRGLAVKLAVGLRPHQIKALLANAHFDGVMISASPAEAVGPLRSLVEAIRASGHWVPPIVLGGSICATLTDLGHLTGVDYVTSDVDEAIRLCGLNVHRLGPALQSKKR